MSSLAFIAFIGIAGAIGHASSPGAGFVDISMGLGHALALRSDGTVWAWGDNSAGQCGIAINNTTDEIGVPMMVPGLEGVKAVAAGGYFSLALKYDGTVWAWGYNGCGELGDSRKTGETPDNKYPEPSIIPGLTNVTMIDAGQDYAMALKDDGTVWAWGSNGFGQLGDSKTTYTEHRDDFISYPREVAGLGNVSAIACGPVNAIAIKKDGTVWLWGRRAYMLGDRFLSIGTIGTSVPGVIDGIDSVISADAGDDHAVFLTGDRTVWASGNNWRGMLGNGSKNYHTLSGEFTFVPIQVPGLNNVSAVDAGTEHSVALLSNGTVWAWGGNEMGQIGDGTTDDRNSPVLLPVADAVKISAAGLNTMVLDASGNVWISGDNAHGQAGNASYSGQQYVKSPVMADVNVASSTATAPEMDGNHTNAPSPLPNGGDGTIDLMLLASLGIVLAILSFLVYWAIKK